MHLSICSSINAIICVGILCSSAVLGQSLSLTKKGETNYWIEATAPADSPHSLQASENLHLWVDIHSPVQEPYSLELPKTGVAQRYFRLIPTPPDPPPIRV